ncbi:MAG: DUF116 domain-containing protein [Lentisphaeria bacterium]|nr:DUF116 domain-containing protein [Lentisphaeria bacterium]
MTKLLVKLNNWLTRLRRRRIAPDELLLLIPHCLQIQTCEHNVRGDLTQCQRCGRCPIDGLIALKEKYGVSIELVSGGRKAVAAAKDKKIKGIVAVACGKELAAGLKAVFPKAVVAVMNAQPEGPCVNTTVDIEAVEAAIQSFLKA